jgi:hypothetical protein
MPSKSKGKLIYIFNFIRTKGYIAILDLSLDAQKIIYLKVRGDL